MGNLIYTTKASAVRGMKRKGLEKTHTVEVREGGGFELVPIKKEIASSPKVEKKVTQKKESAVVCNKIRMRTNPNTIGFKCWERFAEIYSETKEMPTSDNAKLLAKTNGWKEITCITELADWKTFHGYVKKTK